jgi:hypothetical protein
MSFNQLKTLGLIAGLLINFSPVALAFQSPDGRVTFDKSPRLLDAFTTFDNVWVWGAKYYFIINLPEDIGEPLKTVVIQQRQGLETIRFRLERTIAFEGQPRRKGENITIESVISDPETDSITIVFDQAVLPGRNVTIGLEPARNPYYSGIYLFGVTAFPLGEEPLGLYLGVGRLQFYRRNDLWW